MLGFIVRPGRVSRLRKHVSVAAACLIAACVSGASPAEAAKLLSKPATSQPQLQPQLQLQLKGFDFALFAQNLDIQLNGKTIGYEYAIYQGEALLKSGSGGYAIRASKTPMSADHRISVGSTSKTITAAAVVRAIEVLKAQGKSISLNSKIAPYLPKAWAPFGPHVGEITLKDLLQHASGLVTGADTFDQLKQVIQSGATAADWSTRAVNPGSKYCNCNFTLFRIIIPYMLDGAAAYENPGAGNAAIDAQIKNLQAEVQGLQAELQTAAPGQKPGLVSQIKALNKQIAALKKKLTPVETVEIATAKRYVQFVQSQVLAKVGLGGVWINPRSAAETIYYYNVNDGTKIFKGYSDDQALRGVGAGFWFLSAKEYGKFIAGLRAGKIVASFQTMTASRLGMWMGSSDAGTTWNHNGAFTVGDAGPGLRGDWMAFDNGVTAVIFYNSSNWKIVNGKIARDSKNNPIEAIPAPQTIIRDAFNAAFEKKTLPGPSLILLPLRLSQRAVRASPAARAGSPRHDENGVTGRSERSHRRVRAPVQNSLQRRPPAQAAFRGRASP